LIMADDAVLHQQIANTNFFLRFHVFSHSMRLDAV
jgi:hypothetical protein